MNILIAADIFPPAVGGPATYSMWLAHQLIARGDKVVVVTHTPDRVTHEPDFVRRVFSTNKLRRYREYLQLLKRNTPAADVVYAMGPLSAGVPALYMAWRYRKPFVCKVVGDYAWEQGAARYGVKELPDAFQKKRYGMRVSCLRMLERLVCRRACAVVVPSNYLKALVTQWDVQANKVHVIPNVPRQHSGTAVSRIDVTPFTSRRVVFSAGRLMPWKGMQTLISAVAHLSQSIPDIQLVIAGGGPQHAQLQVEVERLGARNMVTLLGSVTSDDIYALLKRADALVLNSGYEGMPHIVLEAFEAGCPVAVSRAGGNPEVVEDHVSGLLFEYNNQTQIEHALTLLLNDNMLRSRCVAGGRKKLAQLSKENTLQSLIDVLKRCTQR